MMEIKQSPPNGVELNDLKKDPINGLKRQSDSELGSNDILQLSDSENEDGDISTAIGECPKILLIFLFFFPLKNDQRFRNQFSL